MTNEYIEWDGNFIGAGCADIIAYRLSKEESK
jgi:hypothetical protein